MSKQNDQVMYKIVIVVLSLMYCQSTVTWSDLPQIRMSQTSLYDSVYIPVNITSSVDISYKTPLPTAATIGHYAAVISGLQNYLHYQMIINITVTSIAQDKLQLSIWVGPQTYIKQLRINYFVMQPGATTLQNYISVKVGSNSSFKLDYRTLDLDDVDANSLRTQVFTNQIIPGSFPGIFTLCSAISGIEYYNTKGSVNQVNVNTQFATPNIIKQTVMVGEQGQLNFISITTILVSTDFYPTPNTFIYLGYAFETTITSTDGFTTLQAISDGGLLTSSSSSLFFGIRGFNFTMEGTRLFLLDIATQAPFRSNLITNSFMKYTEISVFLFVKRQCVTATDYYHVQEFKCKATCPTALQNAATKICTNCLSVCDGCATTDGNCTLCKTGNYRVKQAGTVPTNCVCDYNNGYVQYQQQDTCKLCSDLIPGCVKCSTTTSCDNCGNVSLYTRYLDGSVYKCKCTNNKVLVTGVCLSYQGCLVANKFITGEFCSQCDTAHNFEKNLTNNSSCVCMTSYFLDSSTKYCVDICGDKLTPVTPANSTDVICDDGNIISGDGCSSSCRQQYGYNCTVNVTGQISSCAYKQQIKITYLYTQKNLFSNQATLVFSLTPAQHLLPQNAFSSAVHKLNGTTNVKFDPLNSLILITTDYSDNLEAKQCTFNFTFSGLSIYSPQINVTANLYGKNAKLQISKSHQQVSIITYVALGVSAFALALALIAAFLGQKMMGIQLILPVQAAFFSMVTFPQNVLSPISALWSLKYSNGYNSLETYDMNDNYMLDSRITIMKYSGQYILNYNIMFLLLALVVLIFGIIAVRIAWLEREEKRLEELQKKIEDQDKDKDKTKTKKNKDQKEKSSTNQKNDQQQTDQQTHKEDQVNLEEIQDELEDARQNMKNWKNFMYMIFDRFFVILIVTSMMVVIFCFYIQLSNLSYTAQVYDNSLNAGFFFLSYATIVTGLYMIVYDYKTDKLVVFTCNKGKYAIFYISIYLGFIVVLGAVFETFVSVYVGGVFAIMPLVLIPYQAPYGLGLIDFQNIVAFICQIPFIATVGISLMLNLQKDKMQQSTSIIFAYAIIGSIGLSIILTIARLIKIIDCKKISCIQFTDRKKENANDKNKKKNKVALLELNVDRNWDEDSQDSVRAVLHKRQINDESDEFNIDVKNKQGYQAIAQKNQSKTQNKEKPLDEDDDQDIDPLEKIKMKLRKELKQKKILGKIK